jgi:hypothetical protein
MLQRRNQDLVARLEPRPDVTLRDQVDRLGRAADVDDLLGRTCVDEAADRLACSLVRVGGALAQRVHAAVDVGVVVLVVVVDGLDHCARTLARRGVVEIDERLAVDLLIQDREVAPDARDVEVRSARARNAGSAHEITL